MRVVRHRYRGVLVRFAQPYRSLAVYGQRVVPVIITKLTATGGCRDPQSPYPPLTLCFAAVLPEYEEQAHDNATCTVAMKLWQPDSALKTTAQVSVYVRCRWWLRPLLPLA